MKGVILAAGFGRRMMPLTANTHKALLKIGGRPVLSRIVDALAGAGVNDLVIVSGYRADELKDFMQKEYPHKNIQWVHNEKYETTNNIFSLSLALEYMPDDDVILIECDLIFEPGIITRLLESPHDATALLSLYEPGMDGTVVSLSKDIITAIHPPHLQGIDFTFSDKYKTLNIYKFSKKFVVESMRKLTSFYARSINDNCYYELVLGVMIYMQSNEIHAQVVDSSLWAEIDDPVDMQVTEFKFNPEKRLDILDSTHGAYWNYPIHDFCYVQNAYFPTEGMNSMMRQHLSLLTKSFGSSGASLDLKLSYFLETEQGNVVLLNGSSQIYPYLREQFAGKRVLIPNPTFGEYSRMFPQASTYDDKVGIDTESLSAQIAGHDLVVFVNPNNPTGSALATDFIEEQISRFPECFFLVDESFIDFSEERSISEFLAKNKDCKNVVLLKSLGKALGVPGLRLGYVYSNNYEFLEKIRDWLPIWNNNSVAEYFLELLLKNRNNLARSFKLVKLARQTLAEKLKDVALVDTVYPSQANFLLVKARPALCPDEGLASSLLQQYKIYIKDVSRKFDLQAPYFRFAVQTLEANDMLLRALQDTSSSAVKEGIKLHEKG